MKERLKKLFSKQNLFVFICLSLIVAFCVLYVILNNNDKKNMSQFEHDSGNKNISWVVGNDGSLTSENLWSHDDIVVEANQTLNLSITLSSGWSTVYFSFDVDRYTNWEVNVTDSPSDNDLISFYSDDNSLSAKDVISASSNDTTLIFHFINNGYTLNFMNIMLSYRDLPYEPYNTTYYTSNAYANLEYDFDNLQDDYDELNRSYQTLQSDYSTLNDSYTQLQSTYNTYVANHSYTNTQYNDLNSLYTQLQSDYNTLNSNYTTLQSTYNTYVANHSYTNTQYNDLNSLYTQLQSDYSSLNSLYTQLQSDYSSLNSLYTQLQSDYNSYVVSHSYTNTQYETLENNYDDLQADYDELNRSYETLLNDYSTLDTNYNTLNSNFNRLQADYNSLNSNYISLQSTYNTYVANHSYTDTQYNELNSLYTQLQSTYNDLLATYNELQANYDNAYDNGYNQGYQDGLHNALINEENNNLLLNYRYAEGYQNNNLLYTSYNIGSGYDENYKLTMLYTKIGYDPLSENDYLTYIDFYYDTINIDNSYYFYLLQYPFSSIKFEFYNYDTLVYSFDGSNVTLPVPISFNNEFSFNRLRLYNYYSQENDSWVIGFGGVSSFGSLYLGTSTRGSLYNSGYYNGFDAGLKEAEANDQVYQNEIDRLNGLLTESNSTINDLNFRIEQLEEMASGSLNTLSYNMIGALMSTPFNILHDYLNWNFFGINLFSLFTSLITLLLVVWVIKFLLGRK